MRSYESYREAELDAALGGDQLRAPEVRQLVDRAVHSSVNGVVITDATLPENPIVYVNPAFELISGFVAEEALGRNCRFLQGDDRDQPALDELRVAVQEGHECRVVLRNYKKDGTLFWNELSISPVHDEEGVLVNFVGVQNDITERKRAEEALRESEERYRVVAETASDAIFIIDKDSRILFVNGAAERIFGYASVEMLGEQLTMLMPEYLRHLHQASLERYTDTGRRHLDWEAIRLPGLHKSGKEIPLEISFGEFVKEGERFFTGFIRDVTERKRAEEALRKSEDRLSLVVESTGLGTWDFNPTTGELKWDERCKAMFGLPPEAEVDYGAFLAGLHPEDQERADRMVRRVLDPASGGRFDAEYRTVGLGDGVERWVAARGQAFFDEAGRAVRFIGTVLDITRRKRAEEAQRFLAEAGAALSSSLDYRATLASVTRLTVPYLADWCTIDILEEDGTIDRLAVAHQDPQKVSLAHELQERYPPNLDETYGVARVLHTGKSELASEIPESLLEEAARDAEHREILRGLGLKSYLTVPLVARERTLGAITLVSAESGRRYGPAELELAEELARRAALAVDNARLYRHRSEIARTLQGSLLPSRLPDVPGVEVGLRYLPAGEVDVGGDFYDLFDARTGDWDDSSEPSSWGVVIGDVCGKGAEAAAVLALARYTIRAIAMREICPAAVLAGLNEAMLRQRHDHRFCTLVYLRMEADGTGQGAKINVSRGGHAAPLLLGADGDIRKIGDPGRAIGVFDDANLSEQEVSLTPGDALVLYTDGVTEARSPNGAFFGEERLAALLRSCTGLDASTIAGRIESAVLGFQENVARDDVAVLVLRIPL